MRWGGLLGRERRSGNRLLREGMIRRREGLIACV